MPSLAEMPGPTGGLRALMAFNRDAIGSLARWHAEFGDTFGWRLFGQHFVSLRAADDVAAVLLDRGRVFRKDDFTAELSRLLGDGLLTSEGEVWRGRRKLVAPTLRRSHIKHYADIFVRHARRWVADVTPSAGPVDLHHQMMQLTLGIVAEALFAVDEVQGSTASSAPSSRRWRRISPSSAACSASCRASSPIRPSGASHGRRTRSPTRSTG